MVKSEPGGGFVANHADLGSEPSAAVAMLWLRDDGQIISATPAAADQFRYTPAQLQQMTFDELTTSPGGPTWADLREALRTEGAISLTAVVVDGAGEVSECTLHAARLEHAGAATTCLWLQVPAPRAAPADLRRQVEGRTAALRAANRRLQSEIADRRRAESHLEVLRSAVEQATDGIAVADLDGRMIFVNPRWAQMHGRAAEDIIGRHISINHSPRQMESQIEQFLAATLERGVHHGEVGHVNADGVEFQTWMNVATLRDEFNQPFGYVGIARDLTDAQRQDEKLRLAHQRERELSQRLAALHDISMVLSKAETLDDLCRAAVSLGHERLGFSRLGLWLRDGESARARGTFGISEDGTLRDERDQVVDTAANCPMGQVLRGRQPAVVQDDAPLFDHRARPVGHGAHAAAALWDGRAVCGALTTDDLLEGQALAATQIETLRLYATTLGHMITRKRTEETLRERAEFENLIAQISTDFINLPADQIDAGVTAALRNIGQSCRADRAFVVQIDEDRQTVSHTHEWCVGGVRPFIDELKHLPLAQFPWVAEIFRHSQVLHVPSVADLPDEAQAERAEWLREGYQSFICVPMVAAGGLFGYVGFGCLHAQRSWGADTIALLTIVGQMLVNVLDRQRAELALLESEQRYRSLVENIADGVVVVDHHQIRYVSPAICRILACTPEELVGSGIHTVFAPHEYERLYDRVARLEAGETLTPTAYHWIRRDGSQVLVELSSTMIRSGGRPAILTVARDVTQREQAHRALRRSEERYRGLVESQRDLIVRLDTTHRFTFVNDAFCRTFGRDSAALLGSTFGVLIEPEAHDAALVAFERLHQPPHRSTHEQEVATAAGHRCLSWELYAIHDDDGNMIEIQGIGRDITELRRAEEEARQHFNELAHATRLNTMGEMASSLAHELNQPLSAVSNYLAAALRRLRQPDPDTAELVDDVQAAATQTKRAGEFVRRIKDFIRKRDPQPVKLDINQTARQAAELTKDLFSQHGVPLELDLAHDLPLVWADNIQVQQVLINLLCNSVESLTEPAPTPAPRVMLATHYDRAAGVVVEISDNGPGLPEEPREIFDAFFTTKRTGTGLGLSISRSIIRAHGGDLTAAHAAPSGARFSFNLPINDEELMS